MTVCAGLGAGVCAVIISCWLLAAQEVLGDYDGGGGGSGGSDE